MVTAAVIAAFGGVGALLIVAGVRDAIRDRRRPVRTDPAYSSRRPGLER